jgi:hypothetical protein
MKHMRPRSNSRCNLNLKFGNDSCSTPYLLILLLGYRSLVSESWWRWMRVMTVKYERLYKFHPIPTPLKCIPRQWRLMTKFNELKQWTKYMQCKNSFKDGARPESEDLLMQNLATVWVATFQTITFGLHLVFLAALSRLKCAGLCSCSSHIVLAYTHSHSSKSAQNNSLLWWQWTIGFRKARDFLH